ncbi:MAG: MBL fold metallo-hydrolase [Bacteroidetes bacterium]|nr:MBL fold metallo-hydrolase [Bacteroidota bacterium]
MNTVNVTILGCGTSQGVPVIACPCDVCNSPDLRDKRLRSSILIKSEKATVVVDTGPDFRQQMLREKVKTLDAVLITHSHKDHIAGMDDVRSFNFLSKKAMKVNASPADQAVIRTEFAYAFGENKYPGVPKLDLIQLDEQPIIINDLKIQPIQVLHRHLSVYAFRIGPFAYITDANYISENAMKQLEGVEYLVIDALRKEKHISHFTLDEAIEVSRKIGARKTWFTHISHLMGKASDVNKNLPENMALAWDGMLISFDL